MLRSISIGLGVCIRLDLLYLYPKSCVIYICPLGYQYRQVASITWYQRLGLRILFRTRNSCSGSNLDSLSVLLLEDFLARSSCPASTTPASILRIRLPSVSSMLHRKDRALSMDPHIVGPAASPSGSRLPPLLFCFSTGAAFNAAASYFVYCCFSSFDHAWLATPCEVRLG